MCEGFPYLFEEMVNFFPTNMSVTNIVSFPNNSTSTLTLLFFLLRHVLNCLILNLITHDQVNLLKESLLRLRPPGIILLPPIDPESHLSTNAQAKTTISLSYLKCQSR